MRNIRHLLSWVLALGLIGLLVQINLHPLGVPSPGGVKFYDAPGEHIVFSTLSAKTGVSVFEPAGRLTAGVLELLAALLLLLPFSRRAGALLLTLMMTVGVALHLSPWLGQSLPLNLGEGATGTDGGRAFLLAVLILVASLLCLIVHPAPPRRS